MRLAVTDAGVLDFDANVVAGLVEDLRDGVGEAKCLIQVLLGDGAALNAAGLGGVSHSVAQHNAI